jgi:3-hydroxyisobutyrate dehydrogenase
MLGEAVGLHLIKSGYHLTAYNRTKSKTKNLKEKNGVIVDSPKNADVVKDILFRKDGVVAGKHDDMTIADMSTINPIDAKEISKKIHEQGIKSLEIPVMGGPNVAIDGKLVLMASGNKAIYEKYIKIFETIATETFFLGESGSAHGIKLAMNLQISLLALSLSEGITLTKKAGFDPEKFLEILNSTYFSTGMSQKKAYKMIKDEYQPTFTLKNMKKDLDIITKAAKDFGAVLPMAEHANKIYSDALEAGLGEIDYTGILAHIKKNSNA